MKPSKLWEEIEERKRTPGAMMAALSIVILPPEEWPPDAEDAPP